VDHRTTTRRETHPWSIETLQVDDLYTMRKRLWTNLESALTPIVQSIIQAFAGKQTAAMHVYRSCVLLLSPIQPRLFNLPATWTAPLLTLNIHLPAQCGMGHETCTPAPHVLPACAGEGTERITDGRQRGLGLPSPAPTRPAPGLRDGKYCAPCLSWACCHALRMCRGLTHACARTQRSGVSVQLLSQLWNAS